jgi:hypothetical protein
VSSVAVFLFNYGQMTLLRKLWFPEYEQQKAEQTEFNAIIKCNLEPHKYGTYY